MLVCADAAAEIAFCAAAFGAVELSRRADEDGSVTHATLGIGELLIMVHGETAHLASRAPLLDGSSPVVIYLYLEDVDGVVGRAALSERTRTGANAGNAVRLRKIGCRVSRSHG